MDRGMIYQFFKNRLLTRGLSPLLPSYGGSQDQFCLSTYLSPYPTVCLSTCLCTHLFLSLHVCQSQYSSACLSLYPSFYPSVCLSTSFSNSLPVSVTVSLFLYPSLYHSRYKSLYRLSLYSLSFYPSVCLCTCHTFIHLANHLCTHVFYLSACVYLPIYLFL